jgi:hypothetical protein
MTDVDGMTVEETRQHLAARLAEIRELNERVNVLTALLKVLEQQRGHLDYAVLRIARAVEAAHLEPSEHQALYEDLASQAAKAVTRALNKH